MAFASSASTKPLRMISQNAAVPPVCTTTGPATKTMRQPSALIWRIISAILRTAVSARRSDEISLAMNAKPSRSRSLNSGWMRTPFAPQTTISPFFKSRSLRHSASGAAPSSRTMTMASIRCLATSTHSPPTRT